MQLWIRWETAAVCRARALAERSERASKWLAKSWRKVEGRLYGMVGKRFSFPRSLKFGHFHTTHNFASKLATMLIFQWIQTRRRQWRLCLNLKRNVQETHCLQLVMGFCLIVMINEELKCLWMDIEWSVVATLGIFNVPAWHTGASIWHMIDAGFCHFSKISITLFLLKITLGESQNWPRTSLAVGRDCSKTNSF